MKFWFFNFALRIIFLLVLTFFSLTRPTLELGVTIWVFALIIYEIWTIKWLKRRKI